MVGSVVEARNVAKRFAARATKYVRVLLRDFFKRFQAVNRESGTDDVNTLSAALRKRFQRLVGIGREPCGFTES